MDLTRRDFVKAVAVAAVMPVAGTSPVPAWAVSRSTMWAPDLTSEETLVRCDRILTTNPDDVLALCHRGQVAPFVRSKSLADADLTRAISLEASPALFYISGVMLDRSSDLLHAIGLLSMNGDIDGKALCMSEPDMYKWNGGDGGELLYLSYREFGSVLEDKSHVDEALVAFQRAASFRVIAQADLERWCDADMEVGRLCEAVIGYRSLTEIEDRAEYRHRLAECERWLRVSRQEWWERRP